MFAFRPATESIRTDAERAFLATESSRKNEHLVPIIRKARIACDVWSKMKIRIEDFEIIVGNQAATFLRSTFNSEWGRRGLDS
jgi:hypothetical protein